MVDVLKTKAQLIDELAALRQRVAELENLTALRKEAGAELAGLLTAEREQRELGEILIQVNAALSSTLNYEAVLDQILEQLGQVVAHDAACLMLVEGDVARAFRWHGYARSGVDHFFSKPTCTIANTPALATAYKTGQPVVELKNDDPYGFGQTWIKSHLSLPIRVREQVIAFLNVDSATPGFFEQSRLDRLQAFAGLAAVALQNAQLYNQARQEIVERMTALKKERNFASAVLDTAGALVMVLNPHGRILRFNRACEETTGYLFDEVRGQHFWDFFLPTNQITSVKAIFDELRSGKLRNEYESYWFTKDRRKRLIAWSNTVLLDSQGTVEYIISSGVDITERRQLSDRLVAIHHMGRELNLIRNEDAIMQMTLETAAFLLEFKSAGYGVVNEATHRLDYCYYPVRGVPKTVETSLPLELEARITELMAYCTEVLGSVNPAETLPVFSSAGQARRLWLSVPMRIGERTIGVLDVEGHEPDQFTANDRQLLQTLADQTAVAIENAQLHLEAQQRVDELTTLNVISQAITSTLNVEKILTIITDHAIRLLEAMAASVVLHDEIRDDLWFNAASGQSSDMVRGRRLAIGQGIVGWVIERGQPALVPDVSQDPRFFKDFDQLTGFTTRSIICVPLQTSEQTIGAIEVMNKLSGPFNQSDLRLLNWLATPAAIAIQNARLFEQVQLGHHRLQSLSRRLVEVQESERRQIARELHDEAGQALTSLMVGLRLLEREVDSPEAIVTQVAELKHRTNDILENLHRLAIDLRPASLDHVGLVGALRQYIKAFGEQYNLTTQFEVVGLEDKRLLPEVETNLYRIVQEALTNVVRHAQATHVDVLLERRGDHLLTIIEDNGTGFEPEVADQGRLGLVGMHERAEMLNGTLVVESTGGVGTTIYVEVPYVHSDSNSG
ncbi:MAG: GAF domain-containing protein [Anaerolineae bacterium]|nr:GAF domain-containing protein [Anaerolineae bacterium]